jgi:predicted nucleic acid-binding protein
LSLLASLPIVLDFEANEEDLLGLARRHRLTVYDAAYLELALRKGADLASLDTALVAAARADGVVLI